MWRRIASAGRIGAMVMMLGGTVLLAQSDGWQSPSQIQGPLPRDGAGVQGETPQMLARRTRALNAMRQKAMVADADKLLQLAYELNALDKDGIGISPADRMKKLAQIERLAKKVRERMSFAGWAVQAPQPRFSVLQP